MKSESDNILENGYDSEETQQQRLITVLNELEEEVEKQNSWQRIFLRGALYGLGTVVGATVLIALFGSVLAIAVETLGIANIPILGDIIEKILSAQNN